MCFSLLMQSACLVVGPITVGSFCFPLYMHAGGFDLRLYGGSNLVNYLWMRGLWPGTVSLAGPSGV